MLTLPVNKPSSACSRVDLLTLAILLISALSNAQPCQIPSSYPLDNIIVQVDPVYEHLLYPRDTGWIGGDNGHSIPLSGDKVLWLFSDTIIGSVVDGQRIGGQLIYNSIAIQDTSGPAPGTVQFYWDTSNGNGPFFPHQEGTPGDWYWPNAGAMLDGELFLFANSAVPGTIPGFSDFEGWTLIRIPNPQDPPENWIQNAYDIGLPVSYNGAPFIFTVGTYVEEPYLYMLMLTGNGGFGAQQIARVLISDLKNGGLGEAFEFWTSGPGGNAWRDTFANLVTLFLEGVAETEIYYDEHLDLYITFTQNVFAPYLTIRTAPELTGPWSAEACVYEVPEVQIDPDNIILYEFRSHPELSTTPGELVLTYQTNWIGANGYPSLFTPEGLEIYWPHFLRMNYRVPLNATENWSLYR